MVAKWGEAAKWEVVAKWEVISQERGVGWREQQEVREVARSTMQQLVHAVASTSRDW